jgi:lysozyme
MREIPQAAVAFVAAHEALRLESYQDAGSVWTIGYGHTGPDAHAGMRITYDQATAFLTADLITAAARLASVVSLDVIRELTDNQYSALLSFVFNLGNGADPKTGVSPWTIWKRLNARQFDQVPVEMMRFVYCGKLKLQGLVNRRTAEVALWSTAEPGSAPDDPSSGFTRAEPTPPVALNPVPLAKQPAFMAVAVSVVLAAPGLISQAVSALTPYATDPIVQHVLDVLTRASPLAGALSAFVLALQHQQSKT